MKKIFTGYMAVCGMLLMTIGVGLIAKQMIDERTIALLSGAMAGVLVTAPCAVMVTLIFVRRGESRPQITPEELLHMQMLADLEQRLMAMGIDPRWAVFKPEPGTQLTVTRQPGSELWRQ
jgi:hypothetical protein